MFLVDDAHGVGCIGAQHTSVLGLDMHPRG